MKVCVVGGGGFLGRHISRTFTREGLDVVSADIAGGASADPSIRHVRMDVTSLESVVETFSRYRPDIVIHLSFMRQNLPRPAFNLNVLGMENCLEASRLFGVRRVVCCSSIAVNGGQASYGTRAITEDDPPAPRKQYDVHKVFNEWQAREYAQQHGMSVVCIRAANVSGSDKTIGSVDHVDCIVKPARGEPVRLDYRDRMRCAIHCDDVVQAFLRIALAEKPRHIVYNTGGEAISLGRIAETVRGLVPDARIDFDHETGGEALSGAYLFSNDRIRDEFGLVLPPYEERIAQMIDEIRSGRH